MKDTLTLYEELIASGVHDAQAKIQAHQLGDVALEQLDIRQLMSKIDKDLMWMRLIGGAMVVTFFSNGFFMWLAK